MSDSPGLPRVGVAARVLKGAAWLTCARIGVNIIGLASTLIMARLLTPEDFGLVAIASGVLAIASAVTTLPLFTVLVQVETLTKKHLDTAWTLSALRGLLICTVLISVSFPLAALYEDHRLVHVIIALSSVMMLNGLNSPATAILTRDLQFWQDFVVQILTKSVGFAVGVFFAWFTHSYWALVAGNIAGTMASTIVSFLFVKYKPRIEFSEWRLMFGFASWLTLSQVINTANWQADQLILGWRLGTHDLGQYTVGANIAALPTREATGPLIQTIFPAFSAIVNNPDQLKSAVDRTQSLLVAVALPLGLGFALVADHAVPVLLGEKWISVVPIVQCLSCLYGFQTIAYPTQALGMAKRENRALVVRDAAMLITGLPLVLIGLFTYGLMGAIWGRVAAGIVNSFINMEMIHRLGGSHVHRQILNVWRSLVSGAGLVVIMWVIQSRPFVHWLAPLPALIALVVSGAATYCGIHWLLWLTAGRPRGVEQSMLDAGGHVWMTLLNWRTSRV